MFHIKSDFEPAGHQPQAIDRLSKGLKRDFEHQVLLGVTGSGKTYVMAQVIQKLQRPALIMTHNKTLAAQLFNEFREFFPQNAVEYFVSYYDFYQPEAYMPSTGTYIEKDAKINDEIDRLRHRATWAVYERSDFVIVASVSCIYGLGSPDVYKEMQIPLSRGDLLDRDAFVRRLVEIQYERNDIDFKRSSFRVRGDVVEVFPPGAEEGIRVEFFGDEVDEITQFDPVTGAVIERLQHTSFYPAKHYVSTEERREAAVEEIFQEMKEQVSIYKAENKLIEAQRIQERTMYDLEMLREIGYCPGIENYSRHMDGREAASPPQTLIDYLPPETIIFVDESHVTLPQVKGMVRGDRARKSNLVDFGFRLPSAYDNRPLTYDEFQERTNQKVYVSATPADMEMQLAQRNIVELIVRPTGLVDPPIEVRPAKGQVDDLLKEIRIRVKAKERVLVTTLTKRMAEDLTEYLKDLEVKVRYLHCDIDTLERVDLLRELRLGTFDVLVGINLLREGLDLPEVSLVAVLDADREGFLRSTRSLIQTCGRAARHVNGHVLLYADEVTDSMAAAMQECERRRKIQLSYNEKHGIVPRSVVKGIGGPLRLAEVIDEEEERAKTEAELETLMEDMHRAAAELKFEEAAKLRDQIFDIESALKEKKESTKAKKPKKKRMKWGARRK